MKILWFYNDDTRPFEVKTINDSIQPRNRKNMVK